MRRDGTHSSVCGERIRKSSSQVTTGHSPPKCFCTASSIPVACKRHSALEMGASAVNQLALGKSIWPQSPTTPRTSGWLEAFCWQDGPEMRPLRAPAQSFPPRTPTRAPFGQAVGHNLHVSRRPPLDAGHPPLALMAMLQSRKRRCADKQPRENHPNKKARGEGRTQSPSNFPPQFWNNLSKIWLTRRARCEKSTGGTTLRLPHSLRLPRGTQRILTGSRGVVVPIFATFEGYGRPKPWCEALADSDSFLNRETPCLPAVPPTLADEQSPQRQRRHPPRPNGRRHTTTILCNI